MTGPSRSMALFQRRLFVARSPVAWIIIALLAAGLAFAVVYSARLLGEEPPAELVTTPLPPGPRIVAPPAEVSVPALVVPPPPASRGGGAAPASPSTPSVVVGGL